MARRNGKVFVTGNSGFPKSMDVSKQIDRAAGAEREVIGTRSSFRPNANAGRDPEGFQDRSNGAITAPATDAARQWSGWGTSLKPAFEPCIMARKPLAGTVAENVLRHGTGAINIDGCRIAGRERTDYGLSNASRTQGATYGAPSASADFDASKGRFPANLTHDGSPEVLAVFPDSAGSGGSVPNTRVAGYGAVQEYHGGERQKHDAGSGSAARFFYCAKASKRDRGEGNTHPTVKPTSLMRFLCRLVTPPGGTVLDPFTGSGSTGKAAMLEGFRFIGCEMDPEYWLIAHSRIDAAAKSCNTGNASTTEEE